MIMPRFVRLCALGVILGTFGLFAPVGVSAGDKPTRSEGQDIMPLKQVRAGMRGYGLTVFRGTKIEKFDVKVIGVLPRVNFGKSWILVRIGGGPLTKRQANVIAGMSGSPVYVGGKLIGAVSYGSIFPREPLAFLTPIEDMLEAWDPHLPPRPSGHSSLASSLESPLSVGGRSVSRVVLQAPGTRYAPASAGSLVMVPLMTPVRVSGVSARGVARLGELLAPYGLAVSPGPGSSPQLRSKAIPLQAGSAVGVALAWGDVEISGVGTLTYRKGNKIVAFGHPMLAIGALDAPMTTAYVHDIWPGLMFSEKIASPVLPVGRISQDRPFSIAGEVGKMANMIPISVAITDHTSKRSKKYSIKVIDHPLLAAELATMVVDEAVFEMHSSVGEATTKVTFVVDADEVGQIRRQNVTFNPTYADFAAISDLAELLFTLKHNKFYPLDVKSIKMWVEITDKRDTAVIERLFVKKSKYEPGETVDVSVVLKPYKKDRVTKHIKVVVPKTAANGRATLLVRGGLGAASGMRFSMGQESSDAEDEGPPGLGGGPGADMAFADNIKQLVKKYLERDRNDEIVGKLLLAGSAPNISGEKLSYLPDRFADVIRSDRNAGPRAEREEVKVVQATEYIVSGSRSLPITIQKEEAAEKKAAPKREEPSERPSEEPSAGPGAAGVPPDAGMFVGDEEVGGELVDTEFAPDISEAVISPPPGAKVYVAPVITDPALLKKLAEPRPGPAPKPDIAPPEGKKDEKPVGRAAVTWTQTKRQDFASGLVTGVSATTGDDVRLSPTLQAGPDTDESYVWSLISDGSGGVYAGSGNGGMVFRLIADGKLSTVYDSPELEVLSLVRDSSGAVYAGTSPNGIVYKINVDGKASKFFDADEKHIAALALDSKGNVYAAAGDKSLVYKITADGKSSAFFSSNDEHAQALAVDAKDNLYVGTAPNGMVYRVDPDGRVTTFYDAAESSITALITDSAGNVYVAAMSKPVVIKIPAVGEPKVILDKATTPIMTLAVDGSGAVFAQAQDKIHRIQPDEVKAELDSKDDVQFISMALDPGGRIFAGTGTIGSIYATSAKPEAGVYESVAHDCKLNSQWGTISWAARLPVDATIAVQTRTGNSAEPDGSWSEWSAPYVNARSSAIVSPPARYIQYRAELNSSAAGQAPELKDVSIVYMPANQPPTVKLTSPSGGEKWSKTQTVKWSGSDADNDVLTYDVCYSDDNGVTWKPLKMGAKSPIPEPAKTGAGKPDIPGPEATPNDKNSTRNDDSAMPDGEEPVSEEMIANILADLEGNPQITQYVRDQFIAEVEEAARPSKPAALDRLIAARAKNKKTLPPPTKVDDKSESGPPGPTKDTSYSWDTKTVKDGVYVLKVIVSDKTSNAVGALTAEKLSEPVVVVNKPPKVVVFKKAIVVQPDKSVKLDGLAWQGLASITNAQYRVGNGDWMAVAASDGLFDSGLETFALTTSPLQTGERFIEVKVFDAAGNSAEQKVSVKIP